MPRKTAKIGQRKKASKKTPKNKSKKQLKKALNKKIGFTPLSLTLLFLVVLLPLATFLVVHFATSSNDVESCSSGMRTDRCINNLDQKSDKPSGNDDVHTDSIEGDDGVGNNQESNNKHNSGSSSPSNSNSVSSASNDKSQGSNSNSTPSSSQPSSQGSGEDLKVGSSYMGGTIPSSLDIPTCFGPTLCAWYLDGSDYANIYMTEDYHWGGRFLDIVGGSLVTSENNHWKPSNNKYYYSENIPGLFSSDMVAMAKSYGLRVINKKLYLTINGVTYSFHPGNNRVVTEHPVLSITNGSLSMPPNSQVSFDIGVSPWFYDPDIFSASHIISSVNSRVVSIVGLSKKADGVLILTLKSGDYKHGASTGITFYGQQFVVYVMGQ